MAEQLLKDLLLLPIDASQMSSQLQLDKTLQLLIEKRRLPQPSKLGKGYSEGMGDKSIPA
ncbi:hypothetical protein D3C81_2119810 [compost metagenome]